MSISYELRADNVTMVALKSTSSDSLCHVSEFPKLIKHVIRVEVRLVRLAERAQFFNWSSFLIPRVNPPALLLGDSTSLRQLLAY